jgi:hypothetical protein
VEGQDLAEWGKEHVNAGPTLDHETAARLAQRVHARIRRCWHNAATAVHHLSDGARYVEGWVVVNQRDPYVIEHGWCESAGTIVDPSYTAYVTRGISRLEPPLAYFAGMRFQPSAAAAALMARRLPIAWAATNAGYEEAFRAAWQWAVACSGTAAPPTTRVVNCRRDPFDVLISRPSRWANPFQIGHDGTRDEVIDKYRRWLIRQPHLLRDVKALRGRVLGCDCPPRRCHGDVLACLANVSD